jgi:hypothetical protein
MLKDLRRTNKLEPPWIGPYTVLRQTANGSYIVADTDGIILDRTVPRDQIKFHALTAPVTADSVYTVRKILDHRKKANGTLEFLIDWKGYSLKDATWEPETHIVDHDSVKDYWAALEAKQAVSKAHGRSRSSRRRPTSSS